LLNGGALEGLAITFFLLCLFYLIRAIHIDTDSTRKHRDIIKAILFANISMYTHERYIVLLPFIGLLILIYPGLKILGRKQKIMLILIAIASVCLNFFLKKLVYNMPFFVGTGGTNIELSSASPFDFFIKGLLSILQVNKGPDYLAGMSFDTLPLFNKSLVVVLLVGFFIIFFTYFVKLRKRGVIKQEEKSNRFWILPFLWMLLILLLIPAVLTIRLEQRWLQASFIVFILSFIIAFSYTAFRNNYSRVAVFSLFFTLLTWSDFTYLNSGGSNIYMATTEKLANRFEEAIDKGIIRQGTKNLYIWEKQKDINAENEIKWVLAEGYFFNYYQQHAKKIIFADSLYKKDSLSSSALVNLKTNADQVINLENGITDITNEFLKGTQKPSGTSMEKQH
jgi:hypothetical protein